MIKVREIQNIFCRSLPCYSNTLAFTSLPFFPEISIPLHLLMSTSTIYYIVETENLEGKPHFITVDITKV